MFQKFRKGVGADRGGWHEEILPMPQVKASFLHPFSYAPLGEEGHFRRTFWLVWGFVSRQPPPAIPVSKPLNIFYVSNSFEGRGRVFARVPGAHTDRRT